MNAFLYFSFIYLFENNGKGSVVATNMPLIQATWQYRRLGKTGIHKNKTRPLN